MEIEVWRKEVFVKRRGTKQEALSKNCLGAVRIREQTTRGEISYYEISVLRLLEENRFAKRNFFLQELFRYFDQFIFELHRLESKWKLIKIDMEGCIIGDRAILLILS